MITAVLSGIVVYSMLAGRLAHHLVVLVSVAAAVACLAFSGHDHGDVLSIDRYADVYKRQICCWARVRRS